MAKITLDAGNGPEEVVAVKILRVGNMDAECLARLAAYQVQVRKSTSAEDMQLLDCVYALLEQACVVIPALQDMAFEQLCELRKLNEQLRQKRRKEDRPAKPN
jgi:hypothetical protein